MPGPHPRNWLHLGPPPSRGTPAIPRPPTYGWFSETRQGGIVLEDRWGNVWSLNHVSILCGSFGWEAEGVAKLPRVRRFDSADKIIIEGDRVLIDFVDGNPKTPVVRGGLRSTACDAFLPYNHADTEADTDENRLALRLRQLDEEGTETGTIELEAGHDEGGNIGLELTGDLVITVKRDGGDHTIRINDEGIQIDAGGTAEVVVNGGTAKVARVGDKVQSHTHGAGTLVAGYFTVTGATAATQPAIVEGADRFKG